MAWGYNRRLLKRVSTYSHPTLARHPPTREATLNRGITHTTRTGSTRCPTPTVSEVCVIRMSLKNPDTKHGASPPSTGTHSDRQPPAAYRNGFSRSKKSRSFTPPDMEQLRTSCMPREFLIPRTLPDLLQQGARYHHRRRDRLLQGPRLRLQT